MAQLSTASGRIWLDTVNPGLSEPSVEQGNFWLNTVSTALYLCITGTKGSQVWKLIA